MMARRQKKLRNASYGKRPVTRQRASSIRARSWRMILVYLHSFRAGLALVVLTTARPRHVDRQYETCSSGRAARRRHGVARPEPRGRRGDRETRNRTEESKHRTQGYVVCWCSPNLASPSACFWHSDRVYFSSPSPYRIRKKGPYNTTPLYYLARPYSPPFLGRVLLSTQGCLTSPLDSLWRNAYERATLLHR